jgi:membrane-bound metal-dependent hydrolase YbcI (DUF457 family)
MDNVTHTLFALTLARTRLGRGRGATAALVLASNAPDIDIVAALGGGANYLAWHRGPTHGPLGVVGLGAVAAALVWGGDWILRRSSPDRTAFIRLMAIAIIGVIAHILMDLPTSYGTRLLSPFSWRWFALDLMPIVDVYLLAILGGGLFFGRGSPERRRIGAAIALSLMAANYGVRIAAHQQALAVAAQTFGPGLPSTCGPQTPFRSLVDSWPRAEGDHIATTGSGRRCLMDTAAIPTFLSPLAWRVIAQLPDAYEIYDVRLWQGPRPAVRVVNQWTPVVVEAARTRSAQILFGFSRFPRARLFPGPPGSMVQFTDVRFEIAPEEAQAGPRRSAIFTVTVAFGPNGQVVEERLGD